MNYQSPATGNEISTVMHGVPDSILNDPDFIEKSLLEGLATDHFTVLGTLPYRFTPKGYTILVLLAESHAAIHTYPEHNSLYFNIYSCRGEEDGRGTFEYLKEKLKPASVEVINNKITVKN